jgi:HEPN domain-containing protein
MVKDWLLKAESDLKIGKDEIQMKDPATDAICFHMQQAVEKYLKAFLVFNNKEIRKTHDIAELIEICKEIDHDFEYLYEIKADKLTLYAVEFRYPGLVLFPSLEETKETIEIAEKVKAFVLEKLFKRGFEIT